VFDVVQKLWGFCHTLRHDGIDYGDYIEQITFLLFLKMADERAVVLPKGCDWPALRDLSGTGLIDAYTDILRRLSKERGILGDIFTEAQCRFNKPVNLKQLITRSMRPSGPPSKRTSRPRLTRASWRRPPARARRGPASTSRRAC